jgi:hypothetical protein
VRFVANGFSRITILQAGDAHDAWTTLDTRTVANGAVTALKPTGDAAGRLFKLRLESARGEPLELGPFRIEEAPAAGTIADRARGRAKVWASLRRLTAFLAFATPGAPGGQ